MALMSKTNEFSIAEEDIVCYKNMKMSEDEEGVHYFTSFYDYQLSEEIINGELDFENTEENEVLYNQDYDEFDFCKGFIHTYKNEENALEIGEFFNSMYRNGERNVTFKCVIPAGEQYVYGIADSCYDGYASKKIRFIEPVEIEEENNQE